MTHASVSVDISSMITSAKELKATIEERRKALKLSKREICVKAGVPYSWIVDLFRHEPAKVDSKRAQLVLRALGINDEMPKDNTVDEELMTRAFFLVERVSKKMNLKLNTVKAMACTVRLYNTSREFGEEPSESTAAQILKNANN